MVATGLCQSDDHIATGDIPVPVFSPSVPRSRRGGHRCECRFSGRRSFRPGDHVVFVALPSCGRCRFCASGHELLCNDGANLLGSRLDEPRRASGCTSTVSPCAQMAALGAFSEYTLVDMRWLLKIDADLPLDKVLLAGCCVGTGWGVGVRCSHVQPGDTAIVMGIGGMASTLCKALRHARHLNASLWTQCDSSVMALKLGATHAFAWMRPPR